MSPVRPVLSLHIHHIPHVRCADNLGLCINQDGIARNCPNIFGYGFQDAGEGECRLGGVYTDMASDQTAVHPLGDIDCYAAADKGSALNGGTGRHKDGLATYRPCLPLYIFNDPCNGVLEFHLGDGDQNNDFFSD